MLGFWLDVVLDQLLTPARAVLGADLDNVVQALELGSFPLKLFLEVRDQCVLIRFSSGVTAFDEEADSSAGGDEQPGEGGNECGVHTFGPPCGWVKEKHPAGCSNGWVQPLGSG